MCGIKLAFIKWFYLCNVIVFTSIFAYLSYYFIIVTITTQKQLDDVNNTFVVTDDNGDVTSAEPTLMPHRLVWNDAIKLQAAKNYLDYVKFQQKNVTSFWFQTSFEAKKSHLYMTNIVRKSPNYYPALIELVSYDISSGQSYILIKDKIDYLYSRLQYDQTWMIELVHLWLQYVNLYPSEDRIVSHNVQELITSKMDYRAVNKIKQLANFYIKEDSLTKSLILNLQASYQ